MYDLAKALDRDGDGTIDYNELLEYLDGEGAGGPRDGGGKVGQRALLARPGRFDEDAFVEDEDDVMEDFSVYEEEDGEDEEQEGRRGQPRGRRQQRR